MQICLFFICFIITIHWANQKNLQVCVDIHNPTLHTVWLNNHTPRFKKNGKQGKLIFGQKCMLFTNPSQIQKFQWSVQSVK
jgi:hypothetical protein